MKSIGFGDNVRIVATLVTEAAGIAGVVGQVYGETTPTGAIMKFPHHVEIFRLAQSRTPCKLLPAPRRILAGMLICCMMPLLAAGQDAAGSEWKLAFDADLSSMRSVNQGLCITFGQGEVKDGKLVIAPEKAHGTPTKRIWLTVDNYRFPGDVRLEVKAALVPSRGRNWMHLGLGLASDGFPQADQIENWSHGYYAIVGARGNTAAQLTKQNKNVESTLTPNVSLAPGQEYSFVVERDNGTIRLSVDGRQVFSYVERDEAATDPAVDNQVGLFTRYNSLALSRLAVYTHSRPGEAVALPVEKPQGPEVTLRGVAQCQRSSAATPTTGDHSIKFYAYDGTPKAKATMDALVKDFYKNPMDVEAAQTLQREMDKQALYYVFSNRLSREEHYLIHQSAKQCAITGVEYTEHGRRYIWPTKIERIRLTYPEPMLRPDKPLVIPTESPLTIKVTDTLTMKCLPIPAGEFLQGSPFYVTRWQDEYPHEVTLTKSYFLAEHPVTQEMFAAVMGTNPSNRKLAKAPVECVPFADVISFCKKLSEKNGRTIRLATDAEWEYAARVGTSTPCLTPRYEAQNPHFSNYGDAVKPVKSKAPNAWGLYDMVGAGWEANGDFAATNVRLQQVDPQGPAENDSWVRDYGNGKLRKSKGGGYYDDYRPAMHGGWGAQGRGAEGVTTFRFVVEAGAENAQSGRP